MKNEKKNLNDVITETLKDLYLQTGDEGEAVIPVEKYCDNFETILPENAVVTVKMRWTEKDRVALIRKATELTDLIGAIARIGEPLTGLLKRAPDLLQPGVVNCWNTYLAGFETGMVPEDENFPLEEAAEAEILAAHRASHATDAACRVGNSPYAYAVVMRAGRLYRLFKLNAPESILRREAALFTQALAFHSFAVK